MTRRPVFGPGQGSDPGEYDEADESEGGERDETVRDRKSAVVKKRKSLRRTWRGCWWTPPLGHVWDSGRCVGCDKPYETRH